MSEPTSAAIEDSLIEDRTFPPPPDFAANALASDDLLYAEAAADTEAFWARQARELVTWSTDFHTVCDLGDTTTLADASVVDDIKTRAAATPQED
jgi:acetyl-CoA synthetase